MTTLKEASALTPESMWHHYDTNSEAQSAIKFCTAKGRVRMATNLFTLPRMSCSIYAYMIHEMTVPEAQISRCSINRSGARGGSCRAYIVLVFAKL